VYTNVAHAQPDTHRFHHTVQALGLLDKYPIGGVVQDGELTNPNLPPCGFQEGGQCEGSCRAEDKICKYIPTDESRDGVILKETQCFCERPSPTDCKRTGDGRSCGGPCGPGPEGEQEFASLRRYLVWARPAHASPTELLVSWR